MVREPSASAGKSMCLRGVRTVGMGGMGAMYLYKRELASIYSGASAPSSDSWLGTARVVRAAIRLVGLVTTS